MKQVIIHSMEASDLDGVAALEELSFTSPWSKQALQEAWQNPNYIFAVAKTEKGQVVGYAGMLCVLDEGDILNVAVSPAFQRQGIGSRLMETLVAYAQERSIRAMTLEVRAGNQGAILLYEKMGFQKAGIRKGFYDLPKEDAVIMWKNDL
jgi:ribosomal-protein-alanine N-acetyltransferase